MTRFRENNGGGMMEGIKLGGIEISIKLDNVSAEDLRNTMNYIFSDLVNLDKKIQHDNNSITNNQIDQKNSEITDKQIKYIHSLSKEKAVGKVELQNYSMSMFGKSSSLDLTRNEASQLIAALNDIEYNVLDHLKV